MGKLLLEFFSILFLIQTSWGRNYSGYSVLRLTPKDDIQLEYLRYLEEEMALEASPVEFWKSGCCVGEDFDVMVGPISQYWFTNQMQKIGLDPNVLIYDLDQ